jgi:protein O-mannosyl-transferase
MKVTAGLVLAGVLLFGSSFNDPFHFDDVLIANDANVTSAGHWAHFFNPFHLRQLTFFTFYLNHLFGGADPSGYHVVNVIIHIANAVLLYFLAVRFLDAWVAITAAGIFLVHPIQTGAVLYVYERSTLLACFFSLLALIALAERRHMLALVFFVLAFEGKESAVGVLLTAALLYNSPSSAEEGGYLRIVLLAGALILGAAALGILFYSNEPTVGIGVAGRVSPLQYFLTETRVVYTYLRLLVFPAQQSLEYDFQERGGILAICGILLILGAGYWLSRTERWRITGMSVLAFFLLLTPTSSFVPSADAAFEHRLYLPMLAFSVFAASLLMRIPQRSLVAGIILVVLAVLTIRREAVWSSDIALWEDTVQKTPGKARVWFNLGGAYLNSNPDKARVAFLRSIELQPHLTEALYDLGMIEQRRQNFNIALAYYQRATEEQPTYWPAWNNMANTLFAMGQQDRAVECFEKTLRLNPDYWQAQYNIAIVHFVRGRYADAVPKLRTVLDWQPDFRDARYLLATSLTRTGDREAADAEWKKLGEVNGAESRPTPAMILAPSRP